EENARLQQQVRSLEAENARLRGQASAPAAPAPAASDNSGLAAALEQRVPMHTLDRLANARDISGRLGTTTLRLTPEQLAGGARSPGGSRGGRRSRDEIASAPLEARSALLLERRHGLGVVAAAVEIFEGIALVPDLGIEGGGEALVERAPGERE